MASTRTRFVFAVLTGLAASPTVAAKPKPPPPATDAEVAERDLVKACKTRNAERLWWLFSERLRGHWDSEAVRLGAALSAKELRSGYRYKGDAKKFDGKALLMGSLKRGIGENPCDDAKNWSIVTHALARSHHVFAMKRKDGYSFGLKLMNVDGHWYLDEITKVVAPATELPPEPSPVPGDPSPARTGGDP
jgi:hypothetical protein